MYSVTCYATKHHSYPEMTSDASQTYNNLTNRKYAGAVSYLYQQLQVPVVQQVDLAQAAFRHLQKETLSLGFGATEAPVAPLR